VQNCFYIHITLTNSYSCIDTWNCGIFAVMHVCLIGGQTAGLIQIKLGIWIHLDSGSVFVKVKVKG